MRISTEEVVGRQEPGTTLPDESKPEDGSVKTKPQRQSHRGPDVVVQNTTVKEKAQKDQRKLNDLSQNQGAKLMDKMFNMVCKDE